MEKNFFATTIAIFLVLYLKNLLTILNIDTSPRTKISTRTTTKKKKDDEDNHFGDVAMKRICILPIAFSLSLSLSVRKKRKRNEESLAISFCSLQGEVRGVQSFERAYGKS